MRSLAIGRTHDTSASPDRQASDEDLTARFARHDRRLSRKKRRGPPPLGNQFTCDRLREVERVLSENYGPTLPDDDAGRNDLHLALACAKAAAKDPVVFAQKLAPWMSPDEQRRIIDQAGWWEALANADAIAKRLGVSYSQRQRLHLNTIGAIDVDKMQRERKRRMRWNAKRRKKAAARKAAKPQLKPREQLIMRLVDDGIGMGRLARKAARHKLLCDLQDVKRQVLRVVARLVELGHLGARKERRKRGGTEMFMWPESKTIPPQEVTAPQMEPENVLRSRPDSIGSNRRTNSGVSRDSELKENPISMFVTEELV